MLMRLPCWQTALNARSSVVGSTFFNTRCISTRASIRTTNPRAIIVWGAPLTLGLIAFCSFGLYISLREKGKYDAFPFITLYFIILAMKSGSLVSSWLFVIGVFHYFGVGLDRALFPRKV